MIYRRVVDSPELSPSDSGRRGESNLIPRIVIDLFFQDYFIAFKNACPNVTPRTVCHRSESQYYRSPVLTPAFAHSQDVPKEMIAIPFGEKLSLIPVASPDYIREAGEPDTPQSLVNFRCINRCFPVVVRSTAGSLLAPAASLARSRLKAIWSSMPIAQ